MRQIQETTSVLASSNSFQQAQQASHVAHSARGVFKRRARQIKVRKIINAVKSNPSGYQVKLDDTFHVGLEAIHCKDGALHISFEVANVLRDMIAHERSNS